MTFFLLSRLVLPCLILIIAYVYANQNSFVIEKEFKHVTCGSSVKLANKESGFYLHSHNIKYGSGSGQQSVTAFPHRNDPNSYFVVLGSLNTQCDRGNPVECGSIIRLFHASTHKYLHSHLHDSPLSQAQEVSAYEHSDSGDHWKVVCVDKNSKFWEREKEIQLQHVDTSKFLSSSKRFEYRNVINGTFLSTQFKFNPF